MVTNWPKLNFHRLVTFLLSCSKSHHILKLIFVTDLLVCVIIEAYCYCLILCYIVCLQT